MLRSIPLKTSTGRPRNRKSTITKIPLNLRLPSFGNMRSPRIGNPSNKSFGIKRRGKMAMHDYQKMGTDTLEKLLVDAYKKKEKMLWAIKVLPSDENQEKLEKLGLIIERLKFQIEGRR